MTQPIITVHDLSKRYIIGENVHQRGSYTFRDAFDHKMRHLFAGKSHRRNEDRVLWALKDVNFEVQEGEVLGVIGRNGAGKSTLLKVLSRITEPTTGLIVLRGKVSSLLEVGTGFSPELTGRENIYLSGSILGMRNFQIKKRFDDIVAFSEIERFIDTPVKRYSSGMYMRLAFAVAAYLEPEILIVDEVLAVGDAEFQNKCLGRMGRVARDGRTILFVSHNLAAIQALCNRVLLLDEGRISYVGSPQETIERYSFKVQVGNGYFDLREHSRSDVTGAAWIEELRILDARMMPISAVRMGDQLGIEIAYKSNISLDRADFVVGLYTHMLQRVCQFSSARSGFFLKPNSRQGTIRCFVPGANLVAGRYYLNLAILDSSRRECYDHLTQAGVFDVLENDVFGNGKTPDPQGGPCFFLSQWQNYDSPDKS